MHASGAPTIGEVLHHDWTRKTFSHLPEDASQDEHLNQGYVRQGTSLDLVLESPETLRECVLVARNPLDAGREAAPLLWQGPRRIRPETFYGLVDPRLRRVSSAAFSLLLRRASHFFVLQPSGDPTYLFPLPQFVRLGVSHATLERLLDARVLVPAERLYARRASVPSLRVFAPYDGNRYGHSTRKLFYDGHGNPVAVELVAREILSRLAYQVVPPHVFHRLFVALVGRPAPDFRTDAWPLLFLGGQRSPLAWVAKAQAALEAVEAPDQVLGALDAMARRWPYRRHPPPPGVPLLVGRFFNRTRLRAFLDVLGAPRLRRVLEGFLRGHPAISADWFAYHEGSHHAFCCEVKSRGDQLRPAQKESILFCQRTGTLDYRLLELIHNRPDDPSEIPVPIPPAKTA